MAITNLSIIIPTYHRPYDLELCLESIYAHSTSEIEVLIYHPDADEDAPSIAKKYGAKAILDGSRVNGKRVKSLWGIINDGIEAAQGEFACWLNDDCLVNTGWDQTALSYFKDDVGLVVLKTKGIAEVQEYRVALTRFGVPSANYGILRKSVPVRFDARYHWYQADEDISLSILKETNFRVIGTSEDLIIHNHTKDETRVQNDADPRAQKDRELFFSKWRYFRLKEGRVVVQSPWQLVGTTFQTWIDSCKKVVKVILVKWLKVF